MGLLKLLTNIIAGHVPTKGYKPYVDEDGTVHALSGTEALDAVSRGQTPTGRCSFAAVHKGGGKYQVKAVEWDNLSEGKSPEDMTPDEYTRFIYGDKQ